MKPSADASARIQPVLAVDKLDRCWHFYNGQFDRQDGPFLHFCFTCFVHSESQGRAEDGRLFLADVVTSVAVSGNAILKVVKINGYFFRVFLKQSPSSQQQL